MSLEKLSLSHPQLSIIVPVYKVEQWLPACIDSVLRQSYQNWELILIDDGSPDDCGAICDAYAARDARIRVIHKANAGVSAARNDGLDAMKGDYVTFLDSDDEFQLEDTLLDNMRVMEEHPEIDILQYPVRSSDHPNIPTIQETTFDNPQAILKALLSFTINGYLCSKIYKASLFKDIRLPKEITFAEDTWCLLDLLPKVRQFHLSNKGCYLYNVRGDSAVHSFDAKKCLDFFLMSMKFLQVLQGYFKYSDQTVVSYFFLVYQRLLDARIANRDAFGYKYYEKVLKQSLPSISLFFQSYLTRKNRIWLLLLHTLGMTYCSHCYVKHVVWRLDDLR